MLFSRLNQVPFFCSVDFCKNFTDISCVRSEDYPGLCGFWLGIRAMLRFPWFVCEILSKLNRKKYVKQAKEILKLWKECWLSWVPSMFSTCHLLVLLWFKKAAEVVQTNIWENLKKKKQNGFSLDGIFVPKLK